MVASNKRILLAKIQTVPNVPEAPTGGANAILSVGLKLPKMQSQSATRNVDRSVYGAQKQELYDVHNDVEFSVEIAGSGAGGGSTVPNFGPLIRSCGYAEKIFSSTASNTAQAGTADTITLAAAEVGGDDYFQYLLVELTGGTGSGQVGIVKTYDGTTKIATMFEDWATTPDATTTYSFEYQTSYSPVSDSFEMLTVWDILDGQRHPLSDVRGSLSLNYSKGDYPTLDFKFKGLWQDPSSETDPVPDWSGFAEPVRVSGNNTSVNIFGTAHNLLNAGMNTGNELNFNNLGTEFINLSDRQASGNLEIQMPELSAQNFHTLAKNNTYGSFFLQHGNVDYNTVIAYQPNTQITDVDEGEYQKTATTKLNVSAQPTDLFNDDMIIIVK